MIDQTEIWKDIKGLEGRYQISSKGQVRSLDSVCIREIKGTVCKLRRKGKVLKQVRNKRTGYMHINFNSQGSYTVHRLVANAFIQNFHNKPQVNHKNGIKSDNRVENLEWNTISENQLHSIKTGLRRIRYGEESSHPKLTKNEASDIYKRANKGHEMQRDIALDYNVDPSLVSRIKNKKYWGVALCQD